MLASDAWKRISEIDRNCTFEAISTAELLASEIFVTARSRSGLWLQTTEDRERSRRQSEIPQILF